MQWHLKTRYLSLLIDCLIDWCFTARQHKIDQFVPIYQGGLLAQAFEDSQRETYKTYSYMRYNEHTHATTNNRYASLA